ncbi:PDT-domain-containing protein [Delitschia confertaspora ATCC 74209]|uniref:prephenate dehydratase n=1 Tax=Delitschia confertaspora ATCC 74209 TaxID=1513339 RepID=A0A9P4JVD3_9PLEO|nr:PDT-domain-containing protein [Delitschia confertaspora ATCC 74209]
MTDRKSQGEGSGDVVAFLGPETSYTHQATLKAFPDHPLTPLPTISSVFEAIQSGTAARGVVPLENSTNGSVVTTLDLLADVKGKLQDIEICGEAFVKVEHALLGRWKGEQRGVKRGEEGSVKGEEAAPSADLSHIQTLYSHPQAWTQCTLFLDSLSSSLPHPIIKNDVSSTSYAAQLVAQDTTGTSAAVSSQMAAEKYGLDVLSSGIQDRQDNFTRFLILRNKKGGALEKNNCATALNASASTSATQAPRPKEHETSNTTIGKKSHKALLSLSPPATTSVNPSPSHLSKAPSLSPVLPLLASQNGKYGTEISNIQTRPAGTKPWDYVFLVELEVQSLTEANISEEGPKYLVEEGVVKGLEKNWEGAIRVLGVWRDGWRERE